MEGFSIKVIFGIIGAAIVGALGGWSMDLQTLFVFMVVDYGTGLLIAIWWKDSPKSTTGGFNSAAGARGLIKKGVMLAGVLMAHQIDLLGQTNYIRAGYIIALCVNELGSIGENFGIMGVPMPQQLLNILDVLQNNNAKEE